jgi:hypothetical protein
LAAAIVADCRRPPAASDPRRPLVDVILTTNRGKAPGFETTCRVLAGL